MWAASRWDYHMVYSRMLFVVSPQRWDAVLRQHFIVVYFSGSVLFPYCIFTFLLLFDFLIVILEIMLMFTYNVYIIFRQNRIISLKKVERNVRLSVHKRNCPKMGNAGMTWQKGSEQHEHRWRILQAISVRWWSRAWVADEKIWRPADLIYKRLSAWRSRSGRSDDRSLFLSVYEKAPHPGRRI